MQHFLIIHPIYRSFSNVTSVKTYLFLKEMLVKALFYQRSFHQVFLFYG